jgi:hypothetical protein
LRTGDDELFAVTTLLFMILFVGKAPYSSQGGGEVAENIRNRRFPYAAQGEGARNIKPVGAWQFIWSHLLPRLKDDFTRVFAVGERVAIDELVRHLNWAVNDMREGKRSRELFPTQPRLREGETVTATCDACPPGANQHDISVSLAQALQAKGHSFRCSQCAALKKMDKLENTREVTCALCGCTSTSSLEHLQRLAAKGQPYWCRPCAERQKAAWASQRRSRAQRDKACFVATATYQSEHAPEVEFLRVFRDRVLRRHGGGRAFIDLYYRVGPLLAVSVERLPLLRPLCRWAVDGLVRSLRQRYPALYDTNCTEEHVNG